MSHERKINKKVIAENGNTSEEKEKSDQTESPQKSINPSDIVLRDLTNFNVEVFKIDKSRKATTIAGHDFIGPFVRAHAIKNIGLKHVYVGIFFSKNLTLNSLSISDDLRENNCTFTITPSLPVRYSEIRDFYEIILTPKESIGALFLDNIKVDVIFNESVRPLDPFGPVGEPKRGTKVIPPDGSGD